MKIYNKNADMVNNYVKNGKDLGFSCIRDPLLHSSYGRLISVIALKYPEIVIETIPGITSFSAAFSKNNRIMAMNDDYLATIPSYKSKNIAKVGKPDSLILMGIYKDREKIISYLKENGYKRDVLYAENVGLASEYYSTNLDDVLLRKENYLSLLFARKK